MNSDPERSLPALAEANAHFVADRLAVGGDLDMYDEGLAGRQVDALVAAGITHVLDVREEWSDEEIWADLPSVTYHWDGIDDRGQRVPVDWFEGVVSWALAALAEPDTRVLAHCHMGINRGPSAGFAILLGLGWEPVEALDAIRRARPIAFVAYAEDALRWHHQKTDATPERRRQDVAALASWRRESHLDAATVIRGIRTQEPR